MKCISSNRNSRILSSILHLQVTYSTHLLHRWADSWSIIQVKCISSNRNSRILSSTLRLHVRRIVHIHLIDEKVDGVTYKWNLSAQKELFLFSNSMPRLQMMHTTHVFHRRADRWDILQIDSSSSKRKALHASCSHMHHIQFQMWFCVYICMCVCLYVCMCVCPTTQEAQDERLIITGKYGCAGVH